MRNLKNTSYIQQRDGLVRSRGKFENARRGGEGRAPCCVVLGTKGGAAQAWLQCGWHQAIFLYRNS